MIDKTIQQTCDMTNCPIQPSMVYLAACDSETIEEYILCDDHAYVFFKAHGTCDAGHKILEKLVNNFDGTDPQDPRFYEGEWVVVHHGKVMFHGDDPQALITSAQMGNLAGANIYQVYLQGDL